MTDSAPPSGCRPVTSELPRSLVVLYAGTIVTRMGTFVVPYLTLYLSDGRGMTLAATGAIIAAGSVGLLLGNLAGGWLADCVDRKPTLLAALIINMLGLAALATPWASGSAYAVALMLAFAGVGMYAPAASALIADLTTDAARPVAYTINYVCINVGMGLGPLLGGLIAASSYQWLFVGDIASSLICALLIAIGVRGSPRSTPTRSASSSSVPPMTTAQLGVVGFCVASILIVAPLMGLEFAVPILVGRVFSRPLVFVGVVYTINAACILTLSFPIERVIRGRDEPAMMAIAGLLWTTGLLILVVGDSVTALLLCTIVWTAGEIIASVVVPTYISRRVPASAKGRMLALQDVVRSTCGIACPIGLGLLWDHAGASAVLWVLVALPALGSLVYGVMWLAGRAPVAEKVQ